MILLTKLVSFYLKKCLRNHPGIFLFQILFHCTATHDTVQIRHQFLAQAAASW